jgi:hypothetical protein
VAKRRRQRCALHASLAQCVVDAVGVHDRQHPAVRHRSGAEVAAVDLRVDEAAVGTRVAGEGVLISRLDAAVVEVGFRHCGLRRLHSNASIFLRPDLQRVVCGLGVAGEVRLVPTPVANVIVNSVVGGAVLQTRPRQLVHQDPYDGKYGQ